MAEATEVRRVPVIPAVDVLDDEAVRLEQGDFDRVSLRGGDPIGLVARLAAAGAHLIHLVDLGGARSGRLRPELVAASVAAAGNVPVQASGGVRSPADAEALVAAGAARVVVGTDAFAPGRLGRYVEALGDRLVVAVDVRDGRVSVSGWEETIALAPEDAARRCAQAGVARILCTAVARDGTLEGPDLDLLARVAAAFGGRVLAAGGIAQLRDLERLADVDVEAAVVGRALLEGRLPLTLLGWAGRARTPAPPSAVL